MIKNISNMIDMSDTKDKKSDRFWIHDFTVLFEHSKITTIWPYEEMSYQEKLNATTRFIILVSLFGYIIIQKYVILLYGLILVLVLVAIYQYSGFNDEKKMVENMERMNTESELNQLYEVSNPLSNVMVSDYTDANLHKKKSENRIPIEYDQSHEKRINTNVKDFIIQNNNDNKDIMKLFGSLGNEMEFEQSMRQFYINPSTSIPNNQDDFLNFCYNDLPSEKPLMVH